MLTSCGRSSVSIYRGTVVAILSTGDELVESGQPVTLGKVVDSNGIALAAAVKECGATPLLLGIARDTRESHIEKISEGLKTDLLITSAGVSAGTRDRVREVLAELGMKLLFHRIAVSPASPTCFGVAGEKPIFCLPGNPVASLIAFALIVRPALLKMMGHRHVLRGFLPATLQEEARKRAGKVQILRARLAIHDGKILACRAGSQNTGILKTMLRTQGLVILLAESALVAAGSEVPVHLLSSVNSFGT